MRTRQNRMNGGIIGKEDYLESNNLVSLNQNYNRLAGCYIDTFPVYPFVRPSEWRELPGMTQGDQLFAGLFAVYNNDSNFVAFTVSGNYTVDWGDGTTAAYVGATTAYKRYDRTTYSGLTSSVYNNYKNLVITIRPTGTASLTSINLQVKHNQSSLPNYHNQWLDIKIAGATLSSLTIGTDNDNGIQPRKLKQFEYVGTHLITNMTNLFANAVCLSKVITLFTQNCTSLGGLFSQCNELQELPIDLDSRSATTMPAMFYGCNTLKSIPFLDTSKVTNMESMFGQCWSLTEIPAFNTSNVTNMRGMFFQCWNLKTVPWMDTSKVTDILNMFYSCHSLRKIPHFNTSNVTNWQGAFNDCGSLEEIPPLDFSKATNLVFTFGSSYRLQKLPYLNTTSALTSIYLMFGYGSSITEITFKDTSNVTNFNGAFIYCWNLKKINGLNTSKGTDLYGIFSQCSSLEEAPFLRFDNLVNANGVFYGCNVRTFGNTYFYLPKATSIADFCRYNGRVSEMPPIDAPNAVNIQTAFQNCYNLHTLKGLTLASGASLASFNASGFNNTFENCRQLVEIPRLNLSGMSAAALTGVFTNMFSGCRDISSLNGITGINYNISLASLKLSGTALNEIYSGLETVGASGAGIRTITVSSNWGTATDDPTIAIAKGWTVTG